MVKTLEWDVKMAMFSIAILETYKDENGKLNTSTESHSIMLWKGLAIFP